MSEVEGSDGVSFLRSRTQACIDANRMLLAVPSPDRSIRVHTQTLSLSLLSGVCMACCATRRQQAIGVLWESGMARPLSFGAASGGRGVRRAPQYHLLDKMLGGDPLAPDALASGGNDSKGSAKRGRRKGATQLLVFVALWWGARVVWHSGYWLKRAIRATES